MKGVSSSQEEQGRGGLVSWENLNMAERSPGILQHQLEIKSHCCASSCWANVDCISVQDESTRHCSPRWGHSTTPHRRKPLFAWSSYFSGREKLKQKKIFFRRISDGSCLPPTNSCLDIPSPLLINPLVIGPLVIAKLLKLKENYTGVLQLSCNSRITDKMTIKIIRCGFWEDPLPGVTHIWTTPTCLACLSASCYTKLGMLKQLGGCLRVDSAS